MESVSGGSGVNGGEAVRFSEQEPGRSYLHHACVLVLDLSSRSTFHLGLNAFLPV